MSKIPMKEQLKYLKGITERIDVLHEAQTLQLRNYPLLIPNIDTAETTIDQANKTVRYKCVSKKKPFRKTKKVDIAIQNIDEWIRFIIWDDTIVEISVDEKEIYDSRLK
jgi:hypothetical protein